MAAGLRTGLDAKLYRNTGNYASPVWTLISTVIDLTHNLDKDKAEVKARSSRWVKNLFLHKKGPLDFNIIKDTADTNWATLRDGYINDVIFDMAIADDAIANTGTEYLRADFGIFGFKEGQPIAGANTTDLALDLIYGSSASNNADPAFTTVGS